MPRQPIRGLWNTDRIAEYFGVEVSTVLNWIHEEQTTPGTGLVARKINNRWKADHADVVRFRDMKYAQGEKNR